MEEIRQILAQLLARLPASDEAPLLAWPLAAGAALSQQAPAREFAAGCLRLEVLHPEWEAELRRLEPELLARLRQILGPGRIERLEWIRPAFGQSKPGER